MKTFVFVALAVMALAQPVDVDRAIETAPKKDPAPHPRPVQVIPELLIEPRIAAPILPAHMMAPAPVIVEAPRIIEEIIEPVIAVEEVVKLPPYGFDNYGNAIPEHPYAYINDDKGTRSIEPDVTHTLPKHEAPTKAISYANFYDANPYNDYAVMWDLP